MLSMSKQKFLVADHSKIERKDVFKLCDLVEVDALFTDLPMESALLDKYQSHTNIIW